MCLTKGSGRHFLKTSAGGFARALWPSPDPVKPSQQEQSKLYKVWLNEWVPSFYGCELRKENKNAFTADTKPERGLTCDQEPCRLTIQSPLMNTLGKLVVPRIRLGYEPTKDRVNSRVKTRVKSSFRARSVSTLSATYASSSALPWRTCLRKPPRRTDERGA